MLVVYGVPGSPGASTTAIGVAAQWASSGQEVLLIEADPAGGSMNRNLGIQFTPGAASFVASGSPVRKGDLINHSQDILFTNLHVMPCPSDPSGTRAIIESFAERAEDLRDVSEDDMAVVIDAGRIEPGPFIEKWTASAAGVVVVARGDSGSSMSSLESVAGILAAGVGEPPNGCVVTIGKPLWSPSDFSQKCGMELSGVIEDSPETAMDLSVFLDKPKRKDKKWRSSLEAVAEELLPLAAPDPAVRPRRSSPAPAEAPSAEAPPAEAVSGSAAPAAAPPPASQPGPAGYPDPVAQPVAPAAYSPPPAPTAYPDPAVAPLAAPSAYPDPVAQPAAPSAYPAPAVPGSYPDPAAQPAAPAAYPPPAAPAAYPDPVAQPAPPASYPPEAQPAPYPAPPPSAPASPVPAAYPAAPGSPAAYPPPASPPVPPLSIPSPSAAQPPPSPYQAPAAGGPADPRPVSEQAPEPPDIPPSGSFRDLAARMHTQAGGHKKPTERRGISS